MELVLNWIWQGVLVALATAVLLRLTARTTARLRYGLLWAAVGAIAILPLVPLMQAIPFASSGPLPAAIKPAAFATGRQATAMFTVPAAFDGIVLALCAAWTIAAGWRLACAMAAVRRTRRASRALPVEIEAGLRRWNDVRDSGRPTRLVVCEDVRTAGVLPGAGPVIAISPRLLETLTPDELDKIVVHEWAHVQRHDDRAHVVQSFVRACLGWHPAIWWCDRRLHLEREMACDEMAVAVTGSRKAYAACLARLATLAIPPRQPFPIVAAISASGVRLRVTRILQSDWRDGRLRAGAVAAAAVALVTAAPIVGQVRVVATATASGVMDAERALAIDGAENRTPAARDGDDGAAMHREVVATAPRGEDGRIPPPESDRGTTASTQDRRSDSPMDAPPGDSRAQRATSVAATTTRAAAVMSPATGAQETPAASQAGAPGPSSAAIPARSLPVAAPQTAPGVAARPADVAAGNPSASNPGAPWDAAVSGGVSIGRESREAAVATAGFFSRLGRRVAGSF